MDLIHSIILGIVEGITEFLPISSTGHMILTSYLLRIEGPVVEAFEVFIQLGAILAVMVLYRQRFFDLLNFRPDPDEEPTHKRFRGWRGITLLAITSLPILILGKLSEGFIKTNLFNPVVVTWALAIGGVVLILVERFPFRHRIEHVDHIGYKDALMIGLFQCFALCPGVSRAASTIIGGMCNGLKRTAAAEYSFLAAVPIMFIVSIKDLLDIWHMLTPNDMLAYAVGFVVAFISAIFAVKGLIRLLQTATMEGFGYYRIVLAIVFFVIMGSQVLE